MNGIAIEKVIPRAGRLSKAAGLTASLPVFVFGALALNARPTIAQGGPDPVRVAQLGKALFFDKGLSNPPGQSCADCHNPGAGFTNGISAQNENTGEVPGAVPGRFGNRKPPTVSYARFLPTGLPQRNLRGDYVGGLFYDGRAKNLVDQAGAPLQNPNEMNNLVHNVGSPALVVSEVASGPLAPQFKLVYGPNVFEQPTAQVFQLILQSIAAWESTPEVSPFTSKYDAFLMGRTTLTPQELTGLQLFTGSVDGRPGGPRYVKNAQCSSCHALAPPNGGPDLFTASTYVNVGVPKNPNNPYYRETNSVTNPVGYNPLGFNYIDFGLGDFLYPLNHLPSGGLVQNDPLHIDGLFKTPTLRNVDLRPYPAFIKAYGHNGFFKSVAGVVHFDNTRNLTTFPGEVIDFTRPNPYLGLRGKPLWPAPEVSSPQTIVNPRGLATGPGPHFGNLGLTPVEEADVVAFVRTLSDGFFKRQGGAAPPP